MTSYLNTGFDSTTSAEYWAKNNRKILQNYMSKQIESLYATKKMRRKQVYSKFLGNKKIV